MPVDKPWVLDDPVVHALSISSAVGAVADNEDTVVQTVWAVGASVINKNAIFVEHEFALSDVDGNWDWANSGNGISHGDLITRWNINVTGASRADGVLVEVAFLLLQQVERER